MLYGFDELSKRKRDTYLKAEFPHFWPHISLLVGGKSEYTEPAIKTLLGKEYRTIVDNLVGIGLLKRSAKNGQTTFKVPQLYRKGLELTQGLADH